MKWFLQRFKYVRELEDAYRENRRDIISLEQTGKWLRKEIEDRHIKYTKLTLDEAHEVFSACVDYQRALRMVGVADPVEYRILPIMDKYDITIERNTIADEATDEELQDAIKFLNYESWHSA